jgi:D-sedoheptulose 7-phosphate isomerase
MIKINNEIIDFLKIQESCIHKTLNQSLEIEKIIKIITNAQNKGKTIFSMGNGGSGSTASHFVSDLLKTTITKQNKRIKAISLVDNIPVILAWSNDVSFNNIFVEQLKNLLSKDDILIGFSGSGNSQNLIKAFQLGKKIGAKRIGFTGNSGGALKNYCDVCLKIPSDEMLTIESQHVLICHCIITAIRKLGTPVFKYT